MCKEGFFSDLFSLEGQVALVTGGSKGLGREMARTLAMAGADVAICSRDGGAAETVAAEISTESGRRVVGFSCDVRESDQVAAFVDTVSSELGDVTIAVLNAGVNVRKPTAEFTEAEWDLVMDTNVKGAFLFARRLLPGMRERGYGRMVLLGSILSFVGVAGRPAYCSSKAALLGLTRTLALEAAQDGVCVNAICPGPFDTPMNVDLTRDPATREAFIEQIPVGRWGEPRDLQGLALLLCSPACRFITGAGYLIDGGWTAQ